MRIAHLTPLARRGPWDVPEYGCASWLLALGGEFVPLADAADAPLEAFDLLLVHTATGLYDAIERVLDRCPRTPAVLMLACDAMFLDPRGFFHEGRMPLAALADRASLVVAETEDTAFFQAMTRTPVVHLPIPLPLAAMRRVAAAGRADGAAPRVYLGAGFRDWKNGVATAMAFRLLRRAVAPAPQGLLFAGDLDFERQAMAAWGIEGVALRPACEPRDLWPQLAGCALGLHLDHRRTIGRFSGECAALGIPCVSTAGATMQRALFPDLIVDPWDVAGAARLAGKLLRDPTFRDRMLARAAAALPAYDLAPMARRFRELLARFVF